MLTFWYSHSPGSTMKRRTVIKPRKNASQARSCATVDALLEATARILVREGFDGASTNRIAARAGVSIGSLYQYFPNKEALVAAVMNRHAQQLSQLARAALAEARDLPLAAGMRKLVAAAIAAHQIDPGLHRVLAEETPRTAASATSDTLNRENHVLFKTYLEERSDELRPLDLELAAFVCVTSIESLTHNAVLRHSGLYTAGSFTTLVNEATRLIVGYLQ
jgi:AcrR family transcriptional regulator